MGATVLLTGCTGFLGKVVLSELMRQKEALGIDRCVLLIRGRRRLDARQRFDNIMAPSPCFAELPAGWSRCVDVVQGDLSQHRSGISDLHWRKLRSNVTHVIHCAASVDFDLPIKVACEANITSTLNMLQMAKKWPGLRAFVSTSTAYVTPHTTKTIDEQLAPLPRPASQLLADIHGGVDEKKLLAETGHANTYTYTKCLAEHLLVEQQQGMPLTIVRPSIISASMHHPMPGWIDSKAAFAGFVVTIGGGLLRVIDADPKVRLDIVPVDHVAAVLIDAAFAKGTRPTIVHAVAGIQHAAHIGQTSAAIVAFFRKHRVARRPMLAHLGGRNLRFLARELVHHHAPIALGKTLALLRRDEKGARRARRLGHTLKTINKVFPYFTHHTFRFASTYPLPKDFCIGRYVQTVCRGALTHLMHKDRTQVPIAGRAHQLGRQKKEEHADAQRNTVLFRSALASARGLFARLFEMVTFDELSFKRAQKKWPSGHQIVLVPTHRSLLDFLLVPYLFATRTDLNIAHPRMVVREDWLQYPILGGLLRRLGAVTLSAPSGDIATLTQQLAAHLGDGRPLMLFLEGERSRGRRPLPVREDLLAALAASDKPIALLPLGISYERIAEEAPFLRELRCGERKALGAQRILKWLSRAQANKVKLGHVHLCAGNPVPLMAGAQLFDVAQRVRRELARTVVVTDFHLTIFVRRHPSIGLDVPTLREAITARGGRVVRSGLKVSRGQSLDGRLEASTRQHWASLFAQDLCQRFPRAQVLHQLLDDGSHDAPRPSEDGRSSEPLLSGLLEALARPMVEDCRSVAQMLAELRPERGRKNFDVPRMHLMTHTVLHDSTLLDDVLRVLQQAGLVQKPSDANVVRCCAATKSLWQAFVVRCCLDDENSTQLCQQNAGRRAAAPP